MGVNKHRLEKEEEIEVLVVDNTKVREQQVLLMQSLLRLLSRVI